MNNRIKVKTIEHEKMKKALKAVQML